MSISKDLTTREVIKSPKSQEKIIPTLDLFGKKIMTNKNLITREVIYCPKTGGKKLMSRYSIV